VRAVSTGKCSTKKVRDQLRASKLDRDRATFAMSKPRKTQVPLPGLQPKPRPKTQTKVLPPKSALSQEFIGSDDDSGDEPTTTQQKAPVQIAIHPKMTNEVAKTTPKPVKKTKQTPKPTVAAKVPAKKVTPKRVVAEEQAAESSSSSEESEDERTDIKTAQQRQAAQTQSGDSESASSSDSSSDESEEEAAPNATPQSATRYASDLVLIARID
jgi:hypothetical protein